MPRHPQVWWACKATARAQRRHPPSLAERRDERQLAAPVGRFGDIQIDERIVSGNGQPIRVRAHSPLTPGPRPVHILLHAGAFSYGTPQQLDELAALYVRTAGCVVLAVDYRLAPEHPWPAAVEDAYAVLGWITSRADEVGIDPDRVSIGGVSAGGCIAASTALLARDRGGPTLVFQLLEIPVLDLTMSCASVNRFAQGYLLTRAEMTETYAYYVPDPARRADASPLHAADTGGLPPALVLTAQYDPLRDEGEAYADRLRAAGVAVQTVRARGHVHSSTYSTLRSAQRYRQLTADALARALADGAPG